MPLTLLHTSESEAIGFYHECHSPMTNEMVDAWINRMLDKLGPDDCKFLVRSIAPHLKGFWMSTGTYLYVPKISEAYRYSWGEVAVKCSNNPKLEAVRIVNEKEAIDSKGNVYKMEPYKPILPATYDYDDDSDQDPGEQGNSDLDRLQHRAIAAAEDDGLPPMDNVGPGELPGFGDDDGILNGRPILPFGLG